MKPLPAVFTGGWQRVSMAVGAEPPGEDMVVWWLQAPHRHADLRVPIVNGTPADEQVLSFAGVTSWDGARLTWTPDLTLVPSDDPDTGLVSWDVADDGTPYLLEAGTLRRDGAEVPYLERWRRLPGSATPLTALSSPHGRIVRTGSYALTVLDTSPNGGAYQAVAWRLVDGRWTAAFAHPAGADVPAPPLDVTGDTGDTVLLDDGVLWTVDEHHPLPTRPGGKP